MEVKSNTVFACISFKAQLTKKQNFCEKLNVHQWKWYWIKICFRVHSKIWIQSFGYFTWKQVIRFRRTVVRFCFFILSLISTYEFFRVYFENFPRSARHTVSLRISNLAQDFNLVLYEAICVCLSFALIIIFGKQQQKYVIVACK